VWLEEHRAAFDLRQHGLQGAVEMPGLFGAVRSVQVLVRPMAKPEKFHITPLAAISPISTFAIDSFAPIYYRYAVGYLLTAREKDATLGGDLDLELINNSALTLLLSALGLESHINSFGQRMLGEKYFESIDRLSPSFKYCVVCDIISTKRNWLPATIVGDLKRLFTLRDKLVHYKPIPVDTSKGQTVRSKYFVMEKELGIRCFEQTVIKLHELDPHSDIGWIANMRS
jgi:hypothetical protein